MSFPSVDTDTRLTLVVWSVDIESALTSVTSGPSALSRRTRSGCC